MYKMYFFETLVFSVCPDWLSYLKKGLIQSLGDQMIVKSLVFVIHFLEILVMQFYHQRWYLLSGCPTLRSDSFRWHPFVRSRSRNTWG